MQATWLASFGWKDIPKAQCAKNSIIVAALIILMVLLFLPFLLQPNARGFCSVIRNSFLEPWMLKCLLGGESLLRIVDEDTTEKVEKLLVEC